jgi:hypothetical protein
MSRGNSRSRTFEEFEDVEILKETARAILCRFPGGRERWVPISQTPQGFEWEVGKTQTIEVSEWLVSQPDWDAEKEPEEDARVEDVVCLRETAKAIEVRVAGGDPIWMPKSHVRTTSAVQGDGDRGTLVCSLWIGQQKGLVEGGEPQGPTVADDVKGQRRGGVQSDIPFASDMFPDDDKIPF